MDMLAIVLQRALDKHALQEKVRRLSATVSEMRHYGRLIGASPQIRQLYEQIARVADSDISVLIVGESGTGKELAARTIHEQSRRRTGAFVGINCASLPAPLLESELFGHVRGAFTDAREERKGLFLQADNGTILFDDVIDFPLSLQPKVLRVIQERMLRPVGSDAEIPFNARIVATANRDLESEVEEGRFREDLFYRINVVQLEMPPLRSRGADILLLAQHFLEHFRDANGKEVAEISDAVAERLLAYNWPGNVRELRNAMERAVALTRYDSIRIEDLPEKIKAYKTTQFSFGGPDPAELPSLEAIERQYILHVMATTRGNRSEAAKRLGLDRKTLYRKLISYGSMDTTPERE
jgi:two-component system response regulator HydG